MELDLKDRQLVGLLRENARLSTTDLAKRLSLSRTTVQARIERLERRSVIDGYTIRLGTAFESRMLEASVSVICTPRLTQRIEAELRKMPEIVGIVAVSGVYDLMITIVSETIDQLNSAIDRIGVLEGVERTMSQIVMARRYRRA
jgi:DNA-binding Lrp family transcriptional regulator